MALVLNEYVRKPQPITAIRVTAENMEEIALWCGGVIKRLSSGRASGPLPFIKIFIANPQSERHTQAFAGDWVLVANRVVKVYTNSAFIKEFDPKPVEVKEDHDYGSKMIDCD